MSLLDLVAKLTLDTSGYEQGISEASSTATSAGSKIGSALGVTAKAVGLGVAATSAAMLKFGKASVNTGQEFDKAMSQVAATMGTTVDGLDSQIGTSETSFGTFNGTLREFSQFMGKNTAFSATQAAQALNYMALAGYDAQESMDMLPNVLSLAAAGNFDLARASDMVTDAQTAFGISSERTSQMVDEMAKAASTGNTSVEQLGDAFLVVGGLAAELNGGMVTLADGTEKPVDGLQELEIALTAMANAGVKGSEAGTHMRNMLLKLSSPTDEGTKALEEMGVAVFDADGKMRSLSSIFGDLNKQLSVMKQSDKIKVISTLFNTRDLASAEALLNAVSEDWDNIGSAILDAQGSAALMAETQLDNLAGDVTLFKSALEGAQIVVSDQLTPTLRSFVQLGTSGIQKITTAFQDNGLSGAAEALGSFLADGINTITEKLPDFLDAGAKLFMSLVQGVVENVPNLVSAFVTAIADVATTIGENAPNLINAFVDAVLGAVEALTQPDMIQSLISAAITLVEGLVSGINQAIPKIIAAVPDIISGLITALTSSENIQAITKGAVSLLGGIIEAIPQIIMSLAEATPKIIAALAEGLVAGIGAIGEAFLSLFFGGMSSATEELSTAMSENVESMKAYAQALNDIQPNILDVNSLLSDQGNSIWDLNHAIDEAENGITEILKNAMQEQRALRDEDIEAIRKYRDEINALEQEKLNIYMSQQQAVYTSIKNNAEKMTQEQATAMIKNAEKARDETLAAAQELYYNELALIENRKTAGEFLTQEAYQKELDLAEQHYQERQSNATRFYTASLAETEKYASDWYKEEESAWNDINELNKKAQNEYKMTYDENGNEVRTLIKEVSADTVKQYKELFENINLEAATGFFNTLGTYRQGGRDIEGVNKETVEDILSTFSGLPDDLEDIGKDTLLGMVDGIKDEIPGLKDTSEMSAEEIVQAIEKYLGISSPSRVMKEEGQYVVQGLVEGIKSENSSLSTAMNTISQTMKGSFSGVYSEYYGYGNNMGEGLRQGLLSQEYSLTSSAKSMLKRVNYAARAELQIASPSKVWKQMGEYSGEGYGIGLEDSLQDVIGNIDDMLDVSNVTPIDFSKADYGADGLVSAGARNYVDSVVININAADYEGDVDALAERVSEAIWASAERKEVAYG